MNSDRTAGHESLFQIIRVVLLAALVLSCAATTVRADRRLRIVTFNAECLAAPGTNATKIPRFRWDHARREHLERGASLIEMLAPDVFNLLEVTSKVRVDELVKILHEKGLTEYRGHHVESADGFTGFDVAVIARFPLDKIEGQEIRSVALLDGDQWRATGGFKDDRGGERTVSATIDRSVLYNMTIDGVKLGFLGLHLKSNPDDAYSNAKRTAEAEVARRVIQKEIVARGYLPIVLGDLNDYDPDVPDRDDSRETKTEVLRRLKDYDEASEGAELVNVASKIARKADRYTSH